MPGKLQIAVFRASLIFQSIFKDDKSSITWQNTVSAVCTRSYMTTLLTKFIWKKKQSNIN